eukprot:TRINITY_DN6037_c1_g1_i1.p1 TRINITY_DN6037_c1_g1~~TRINITY_DN6037_c1_g1_i1.p1  ORF type:complete len:214 (-),score=29.44 TRINITY_DN6037_c1_g1_i1:246-887(-)
MASLSVGAKQLLQANRVSQQCSQQRVKSSKLLVRAQQGHTYEGERAFFGEDFGARDPFVGELATGFGEKPLGNMNTEHIIKPPEQMKEYMGLLARKCSELEFTKLNEKDVVRLRNQVPGWRVVSLDGLDAIEQEWKCADFKRVIQLVYRFGSIMEFEHHFPYKILINNDSSVLYQLSSKEVGGLSERDFVVAAKLNGLNVDDLLTPKKARFWA